MFLQRHKTAVNKQVLRLLEIGWPLKIGRDNEEKQKEEKVDYWEAISHC